MLEEITINGKKHPVRFGFAALSDFTRAAGLSLNDLNNLGENMDIGAAITLSWASLKHGYRRANIDFDLSVDDVADLFDEDADAFPKMMQAFGESQAQNKNKKPGK